MSNIDLLDPDQFWANPDELCQIKRHLNKNQSTAIAVTEQDLQDIVNLAAEKYGITAQKETA